MATNELLDDVQSAVSDFELNDAAVTRSNVDLDPTKEQSPDNEAEATIDDSDSCCDIYAVRPLHQLSTDELAHLADEIDELIEKRAYVDAVKLLCEQSGMSKRRAHGLVTALSAQPDIDLVELIARDEAPAEGPSPQLMTEITELMDAGRKLEAIAHYSERMDVGLKEAKAFIEALDDVTDFECEVAERNAMLPLIVAAGAVILVVTGAMAMMWALM